MFKSTVKQKLVLYIGIIPLLFIIPVGLVLVSNAENSSGSDPTYNPDYDQADYFVSVWNTSKVRPDCYINYFKYSRAASTGSKTIKLPLTTRGSYDFYVHYGEDNNPRKFKHVTSYDDPDAQHIYESEGVYEILIQGKIEGFSFNGGDPSTIQCGRNGPLYPVVGVGDNWKLINITRWGPLRLHNLNPLGGPSAAMEGGYFMGAINLESINETVNLTGARSMVNMFTNATSFNSDISGWDVSKVWWMDKMFQNATSFNQDLSGWNVCNVINKSEFHIDPPGHDDGFPIDFDDGADAWANANKPDFRTDRLTCDPTASQQSNQGSPDQNSQGSGQSNNNNQQNNNQGTGQAQSIPVESSSSNSTEEKRNKFNSSYLPASLTYTYKNMSIKQINIQVMGKTIVKPILEIISNRHVSGYKVYEGFNFDVDKPEANISRSQVLFTVPGSWLLQNGAASGDIALIYYDQTSEEWEEADLTEISSNTKYAMYIADLPQYTRYAIVSEDTWGIQ